MPLNSDLHKKSLAKKRCQLMHAFDMQSGKCFSRRKEVLIICAFIGTSLKTVEFLEAKELFRKSFS